jgi:UDP-N-acetyl-D-glucosamine dehydrogenase
MRSLPLTAEVLSQHECVVIATDHSIYDYQMIVDHAPLIVDTRNATRSVCRNREKIVLC